jgi:hypothetical protein
MGKSRRGGPAQRARRHAGSRESERHISISRAGAGLAPAAGRDDHVLLAFDFVRARAGVATGRESGFPQDFAIGLVEGAEFLIFSPRLSPWVT